MPRDKRAPRKVGLTSPDILVPAIVALVIVGVLLLLGVTSQGVARPAQKVTFEQFEADVRDGRVAKVQMYEDLLYATYQGGEQFAVQSVSRDYTLGLLRKNQVAYDGLPQGSQGPLGVGILVVVLLPYLFLGWLTVMMVRAAGSAADVDPDALGEESANRCPECSRTAPREARFCPHCAHPVQWTGQVRQCAACGKQVWKSDRHCRSCGKAVAPVEVRKPREAPQAAPAEPEVTRPAPSTERKAARASQAEAAPAGEGPRRPQRPPTPGPLPGEKR